MPANVFDPKSKMGLRKEGKLEVSFSEKSGLKFVLETLARDGVLPW